MINQKRALLPALIFIVSLFAIPGVSHGGAYATSAHGAVTSGVNRATTRAKSYSRGNCAHCHEQHGSIDGSEPSPVQGVPSAFALFAPPFSGKSLGPYNQSDNFCFFCHVETGSQQYGGGIANLQYSNTFGGYGIDSARDILGAFNLNSYHNLYDIQRFASSKFAFFKDDSDPCVACHNPHRARRNKAHITDPTYTAISRPTDHESLWGDDVSERMNKYTYRAPYYSNSGNSTYEPGGTIVNDGSLTPDYVTFCLDCHQYQVPTSQSSSMNPNTPAGYLTAINWGTSGDMHGQNPRVNDINGAPKNFGTVKAPYNVAPVESNYVLSCLDCHEPHGSILYTSGRPSTYLLRKEVNGKQIAGCGPSSDEKYFCEMYFCGACHTYSHCGGPQGCFQCHYHGAQNEFCAGPWFGHNF